MARIKNFWFICLVLFFAYACVNTNEDSNDEVKEFYTPPISVYIFGEAMPSSLPKVCNTESCNSSSARFSSADQMVAALFGNGYGTSNYFTQQLMMVNRIYVNDLKIFYVKTDSNVTATDDFYKVKADTYTLSDETGTQDKGTVNHEAGRIRIVFTGAFTCDTTAPVSGCANINDVGSIRQPENTQIVMNASAASLRSLSETMAHELGHYFGLLHSFDNPATSGCSTINLGTTKYIMDYSYNATNFQECEIAYATQVLEASPFPKGHFVDNSVLLSLNDEGNLVKKTPEIKVFRGDWDGKKVLGTQLDPNRPKYNLPVMP